MANFRPLKNYMFYCLDRLIERHGLKPPFMDIGCGIGDLSQYLAEKGWDGAAVDISDSALEVARQRLAKFPQITVEKYSLFDGRDETFNSLFLWDVVEHLENDSLALERVEALTRPGGLVLISVPSNPREWRWDDELVGHYRRYTVPEMRSKLQAAGLTPLEFWDFTYPVFWIMRRAYTRLLSMPDTDLETKEDRTQESTTLRAWNIPVIGPLLDASTFAWRPLYPIQFALFRGALERGHEFFVLARKDD